MARTAMMARNKQHHRRKTIGYRFGDEHKAYIRACQHNLINVAEGAVRAGKTIDNVFAFAHELKTTPDKIHLATGSTAANAQLNIGDANGYGLEHIFRGQCRWGKYEGNSALIIQGPDTGYRLRIVIFAGGALANSYKKIRGNSYGMWIATEINLHHDNTIREAFNRQLAAQRRKVFWDLNPDHPNAPIYRDYIDKYAAKAAKGELVGGYNYAHFTIFQNINITRQRIAEIVSQYEPGSIWYIRDIEGRRSIAEGLIYNKLATSIAARDGAYILPKEKAMQMARDKQFIKIIVGVDFGGNGSGHAFVATASVLGYEKLVCLRSVRYREGDIDPETNRRLQDIDPEMLGQLFVRFIEGILRDYGFVTKVRADSEESVLIRGLRNALKRSGRGNIKVTGATKSKITDRIFALTSLCAQSRFLYTEDCETLESAVSMATWDTTKQELVRLDDGTSDIDTMDALEYTYEDDIQKLLRDLKRAG